MDTVKFNNWIRPKRDFVRPDGSYVAKAGIAIQAELRDGVAWIGDRMGLDESEVNVIPPDVVSDCAERWMSQKKKERDDQKERVAREVKEAMVSREWITEELERIDKGWDDYISIGMMRGDFFKIKWASKEEV